MPMRDPWLMAFLSRFVSLIISLESKMNKSDIRKYEDDDYDDDDSPDDDRDKRRRRLQRKKGDKNKRKMDSFKRKRTRLRPDGPRKKRWNVEDYSDKESLVEDDDFELVDEE